MTPTCFFLDPPEGVDLNICRAPSWQLMGLRDASNAVEFDMLLQLLWFVVPWPCLSSVHESATLLHCMHPEPSRAAVVGQQVR
jgi:hypothetical protein